MPDSFDIYRIVFACIVYLHDNATKIKLAENVLPTYSICENQSWINNILSSKKHFSKICPVPQYIGAFTSSYYPGITAAQLAIGIFEI